MLPRGVCEWFLREMAGYNARSPYRYISCCKSLSEIDPFITLRWLLGWILFTLEKWRGCKNSNMPWKSLGTAYMYPRENIGPLKLFCVCWRHWGGGGRVIGEDSVWVFGHEAQHWLEALLTEGLQSLPSQSLCLEGSWLWCKTQLVSQHIGMFLSSVCGNSAPG